MALAWVWGAVKATAGKSWCCTGYVQQLGFMVQECKNHGKVVVDNTQLLHHQVSSSMINVLGLGEAPMSLISHDFHCLHLLASSCFDIVLDIPRYSIDSAWKFAKTMLPSQGVSPSLKVDKSRKMCRIRNCGTSHWKQQKKFQGLCHPRSICFSFLSCLTFGACSLLKSAWCTGEIGTRLGQLHDVDDHEGHGIYRGMPWDARLFLGQP